MPEAFPPQVPPAHAATAGRRLAGPANADTLALMHAKAPAFSLRTTTWYVGYFYFTDFSEGRARA